MAGLAYGAVAGPGLAFAGVDQGIDFTGAGPLLSPARALVTRVQPSGSGWPGQGAVINLAILDGPQQGRYLYYAEDLQPLVHKGQVVGKGQPIAHATGSGQAPGVEIGYAQPSGIPVAPLPPPRPANQWTKPGQDFHDWITAQSAGLPVPNFAHSTTDPLTGARKGTPVADVGQGAAATVGAVKDVGSFLGKISSRDFLLRMGEVLGGTVLALTGLVMLARQVGLATPTPPGPVFKSAERTASAVQAGGYNPFEGQPGETAHAEAQSASRQRNLSRPTRSHEPITPIHRPLRRRSA